MKKVLISVGVVGLVAGLMGWKLMTNKKEIDSRKEVKVSNSSIAVTVAEVVEQTANRQLTLVGTTEANQEVAVASEAAGKITEINFKLGDYVQKGQVLARVDDSYKKLALETARINYKKYEDDVQRYQTLREGDAVSETQLRDMKIGYENAKIQLEQAQKQLEDTYIRAPFDGYITSKDIDLGKFVSVSNTIAGLVDISSLKVRLAVPEASAYEMKPGQQVEVSTQLFPDTKFTGHVAHISPKGDNAHLYPVELILSNTGKYKLKVGTYVNVLINMGSTQPMLTIPRDAIVSSVKDPSVYVVNDNAVQLVKFSAGQNHGANIEVVAGLNKGDKVVTNGQINLMDGAQVSVINN